MANFIPKLIYNSTTLNFTFPAVDDPFNEVITPYNQEAISGGGVVQASNDYVEESRVVKLSFLTKTQLDALRTFFTTWGLLRKSFDYYESNDVGTYYTYTLTNTNFSPKRLIPDGSGDFQYEIALSMRRVL